MAWMGAPAVGQRRWSQAAAAVPAASCDAHSLLQLQDCESAEGPGRMGAKRGCGRGRGRDGHGRDADGGKRKAGQCQLELCGRPERCLVRCRRPSQSFGPSCNLASAEVGLQ